MSSCNRKACNFRYLSGLLKVIMQATLKKISYLENSPAYIRNNATDNYNEHLNELNQRNFYKPHGRPQYSASMIYYVLHLNYMSLQANRLLLEKFPMLVLPLLNKTQQGGVDALKTLKTVHEKGSVPCDCILMIDEMYLKKSAQHQSGEHVEVDKEANLYKLIVAFILAGFKLSIPFVDKAIPKVTFKVGLSPSKFFIIICFNDSPSKVKKNAFYFILKGLFVFKIFKFLSSFFEHVEKTA